MMSPIDELSALLRDAEEAITALHPGVTAAVPFPDGSSSLLYRKRGAHWGFVVVNQGGETDLSAASKRVRVEAAFLVDALYVAIQAEKDREDKLIAEGIATLRAFVASLQPSEGEPK